MGADIADMHTRMRALGQTTQITGKAEHSMQGLLLNARGYGDGWTVAHMLHNMRGFPYLKEKPEVSEDDRKLMQDTLQEARTERDAGLISWMHLRMHGLGEQTETTTREKAIFWREYKKAAKALDAGQLDEQTSNETVKALVGLNYLYRNFIQKI
jgi:hypothetical protein